MLPRKQLSIKSHYKTAFNQISR